jgi:hypothetical protein
MDKIVGLEILMNFYVFGILNMKKFISFGMQSLSWWAPHYRLNNATNSFHIPNLRDFFSSQLGAPVDIKFYIKIRFFQIGPQKLNSNFLEKLL